MLDKVIDMKPQQTINNTMNNNKFNVNVFLHEQCKNAVNDSIRYICSPFKLPPSKNAKKIFMPEISELVEITAVRGIS